MPQMGLQNSIFCFAGFEKLLLQQVQIVPSKHTEGGLRPIRDVEYFMLDPWAMWLPPKFVIHGRRRRATRTLLNKHKF